VEAAPIQLSWPGQGKGSQGHQHRWDLLHPPTSPSSHGIPIAGNFLQQELAIVTGAVELMVVDVQCIMESLPEVARCFHTKVIRLRNRPGSGGGARSCSRPIGLERPPIASWPWPSRTSPTEARSSSQAMRPWTWSSGSAMRRSTTCWADVSAPPIVPKRQHHQWQDPRGGRRGGLQQPQMVHDREHIELVKELIANDVLVSRPGAQRSRAQGRAFCCPRLLFGRPGLRRSVRPWACRRCSTQDPAWTTAGSSSHARAWSK